MKNNSELENFSSIRHDSENIEMKNGMKQKDNKMNKCIEKGSINESVINLCIISFGVGLLALPQKVNYISLGLIPFVIIIAGFIMYWTFIVLTNASRKYNKTKYEDIVAVMFHPYFSYFFIIIMMIGLYGVIILFQVILYKFLGGIINEIFSYGYDNMEIFSRDSFWGKINIRFIICYSISIFIIFPLCLIKTISKMKYLSIFGIFSVFLVIFIILIQCPYFFYHHIKEGNQEINFFNIRKGFDKDLTFIQSISTIIFAFECHAGIFPAISELNNPTPIRVKSVFKRATFLNTFAYIVITITGYLTQPKNTPDLIFERQKISNSDYLMTFGLILFTLTLVTKVTANYNCLRALFLNFMKYDLSNYPDKLNILLTSIILGTSTFIAAAFQNISDYINLISSIYGLFFAVIMPGIIYIKTNDYPIFHIKNIGVIILISILGLIGIFTTYITLKKIFNSNEI